MILRSIRFKNFRNLSNSYSLSKGINVIVAPNSRGKTNFLEGIGFLSSGKSFRTRNELMCIFNQLLDSKNELAFFRIEGIFHDSLGSEITREVILERLHSSENGRSRKTLKIDTKRISLSSFLSSFSTIIFSPDTVDLVSGSPSLRRNDLDDFLSGIDSDYSNTLITYKKIIRSRNKLLEKLSTFHRSNRQTKELTFWNEQLISFGADVIHTRILFFKDINPQIVKSGKKLFNMKYPEVALMYESKFFADGSHAAIKDALADKVLNNIQKECVAGISLYGPHRDDFIFIINGKDGREFASRGQQRLSALMYRIAQWYIIKDRSGLSPFLLLDDIFSELDNEAHCNVQRYLLELDSQILLTALSDSLIETSFKHSSEKILLH